MDLFGIVRNCGLLLTLIFSTTVFKTDSFSDEQFSLSPIVLLPGDGGSQFEGKLNKTNVPHIWCDKVADWFSLWLNLELLAPYILDCTVDNLRLVYDEKTRKTSNCPGVDIRQPGFGNTSSVEWLDPSQFSPTSYYYHIVDALVKIGYTRDVNIRGAPYDFRKAPNEMQEYVKNVVKLIEETYTQNNNRKVTLIGHSMGTTYALYILNQQPQAWKDKFVECFISMSGPFAGAAKTIRVMASGDNLGVFAVNPISARPEQRSMPSSAWLLPYDTYWKADEVLVYTPTKNYTVNDYKEFFTAINYTAGYMMREDTEHFIKPLTAPGVTVHCIHGINVSTPAAFNYTKTGPKWNDNTPITITGNGDGTVNVRSLYSCLKWSGEQTQPVYHKEFPNVDHLEILNHNSVKTYITAVVQGNFTHPSLR